MGLSGYRVKQTSEYQACMNLDHVDFYQVSIRLISRTISDGFRNQVEMLSSSVAFLFMMERERHLLHVFATFAAGGPQVRLSQVANRLGKKYRHTILALDGLFETAQRLDPS